MSRQPDRKKIYLFSRSLLSGCLYLIKCYLMEPLVPSTICFCAKINTIIGGIIMITVIHSIGIIAVVCTPLKDARPSASVYFVLSCRENQWSKVVVAYGEHVQNSYHDQTRFQNRHEGLPSKSGKSSRRPAAPLLHNPSEFP